MLAALFAGAACLAALPGTPSTAAAQTPQDAAAAPAKVTLAPLVATRTTVAPVIDGVLDDAAWTAAPVQAGEDWRSYNPLYGDEIRQRTTVWIAYDASSIYIAFKCDDPDPAGIKTSVTRRDNIWPDDWVGLSLDALGTGQTSYHMMVNPSGIQLDMINTISGNEDTSPDWVWDSAGTPDTNRIRRRDPPAAADAPLQGRRRSAHGRALLAARQPHRRLGRLAGAATGPVGVRHACAADLQGSPGRAVREVIPSVTYTHRDERANGVSWLRDNGGDVGVSGKWGLSTTITLEATLNPDFSQVESDAVQVEVNQRYPVFFSEKRPFFMEGAAAFNLAGNAQGDASMLYAVHTRKIVDPIFGAKLTGSAGRVTFASLTAIDQGPGRVEDLTDRLAGREKIWQMARAQ